MSCYNLDHIVFLGCLVLRLTAGNLRGRMLEGLDSIRSTKSMVRMAIFNIINSHYPDKLQGATVLDLFGGTGILALEAISRGAKRAIINDINRHHREVAMRNAIKLGVTSNVFFSAQNAVEYKSSLDDIDIIFVDPPFNKDYGVSTIANICKRKSPDKEILIVLELCQEDMESFNRSGTYPEPRKYGRSYLQIFLL